ncbi:MAG: hypothetical protein WBN29_12400 [Polyangiales bacterium]
MKISKLALIALLGGALMSFGCSDDTSETGAGGDGGTGGTGPLACIEIDPTCANGDIGPTDENCEPALAAPPEADVCTGDENIVNPASCAAGETTVTIELTQLEVLGDCNAGYDLDGCAGNSCELGGLAPGEGMDGVDNALAGLAPVLAGVDGNLDGVNQAFYDGICTGDIAIAFRVNANAAENCATVEVLSEGVAGDPIFMNLSEAGCLSGTVGSIPLNVAGESGSMNNGIIRATLSEGGLSSGALGATVPEATAVNIANALLDGGGAVVGQVLDINDDLSGDIGTACNALSVTLTVGGVVAPE